MLANTFLRNKVSSSSNCVSSLATLDSLFCARRAVCIRGQAVSGKSTLASHYARHFVAGTASDSRLRRRSTVCFERTVGNANAHQEVTSLFLDFMTRTLFSINECDTLQRNAQNSNIDELEALVVDSPQSHCERTTTTTRTNRGSCSSWTISATRHCFQARAATENDDGTRGGDHARAITSEQRLSHCLCSTTKTTSAPTKAS